MLMVSRGPLRSTGRIRRGRWLPVAFADLAIDGGGMPRLNRIRAAVGSVVRSTIRRNAREFLKATENCRDTQQRVLHDLLKLNDGSRFQREHGLHHVRTVDDFRGRAKFDENRRIFREATRAGIPLLWRQGTLPRS